MRVLHLVKTSDGARWAAEQVAVLVQLGHEVGVVLPADNGKMIAAWKESGATLYYANVEVPVKNPLKLSERKKALLEIVDTFKPDLIHSHFFSTTILARLALKNRKLPIAFQVPGPLHLENSLFRNWDILSARPQDFWIASSHAIRNIYLEHNVPSSKVSMSYYGNSLEDYQCSGPNLREDLGIGEDDFVVGNISYFYAPKWFLGQSLGLKGHELMFETLGGMDHEVKGVFWGEQWGQGSKYENKLKSLRPANCLMPGALSPFEVSKGWLSMDLCIHLPFSENCGGVLEPLLHEVPVLASDTGGLPELIIENKTGLVVARDPALAREKVKLAKTNPHKLKEMAKNGAKLVRFAFDVKRSAREIDQIYKNGVDGFEKNILNPKEVV
ncbi:MAG: glycosyltransferase family 4 protein [Bacteriovoracaceae bacterium]|nr:glycosyltransferase family 4 protein [Bacteriovoracaceae bacterium]